MGSVLRERKHRIIKAAEVKMEVKEHTEVAFFFFTRTCYNLVQAYRAVSGLGLTT